MRVKKNPFRWIDQKKVNHRPTPKLDVGEALR